MYFVLMWNQIPRDLKSIESHSPSHHQQTPLYYPLLSHLSHSLTYNIHPTTSISNNRKTLQNVLPRKLRLCSNPRPVPPRRRQQRPLRQCPLLHPIPCVSLSDTEEIDEQHAIRSHQALYGDASEAGHHDSGSVGAGAALQALKMFLAGEGGSEGGGFDQNKLIGMAMAQAGKLWDEKEAQGASMVSTAYLYFFSFVMFEVWWLVGRG